MGSLILQVGNFMNHGSYAGNAQAFKITALLKLADTRANKPRMTLMHYIVETAENEVQKMLEESGLLRGLEEACKLNLDQIRSDVLKLKERVTTCKENLSSLPDNE